MGPTITFANACDDWWRVCTKETHSGRSTDSLVCRVEEELSSSVRGRQAGKSGTVSTTAVSQCPLGKPVHTNSAGFF